MRRADWTRATELAAGLNTETMWLGSAACEKALILAAALNEVAPLVQAVVVEWQRYHLKPASVPHKELVDALHELAGAVDLPVSSGGAPVYEVDDG